MKTLHRYLLRQVLASLAMTAMVFTLVLLLGSVLRELLPLLVSHLATMGTLGEAVGLLIPFVGSFALPISMLTATLLVFGRFSADQELTAARASGVSLVSLILPILILSLVLCAVSAAVNLEIAPRCRVAYNRLRNHMAADAFSRFQLPDGPSITPLPGYILYVGHARKLELQDVHVLQLKDETNVVMSVRAPRGRLHIDLQNHKLVLNLTNAVIDYGTSSGMASDEATIEVNLAAAEKSIGKPGISDMTFLQLRDELAHWEEQERLQPRPGSAQELRDFKAQLRKWGDIIEPIRVQIHRQVAFSLACFSFALVGIPLGIRVQRRETNIGVAIALGLVAIYYALIILASSQASRADLLPHLWMWAPNFLFQAVGAALLWRANRGT